MMLTFQINRILNNIIDNLKEPLQVKGTNNDSFKEYQKIFNAMSKTDKKVILVNLLYSRGRLIRHGMNERQSIHLEGLGTFEYREDRKQFLDKLADRVNQEGYAKVLDTPKSLKTKLVKEVTNEMHTARLERYYKRLAQNKRKREMPVPIAINMQGMKVW